MTLGTAEIYEAFSRQLRLFILKRVDDPHDAEDLLQEVFIKIHTHLDEVQDRSRLLPWIYQVARNTITDYHRARRPLVDLPEDVSGELEPLEAEPSARLAAGLGEMIASLPETYRQALELAEIQEMKQAQVAERLGISLSGAKSRVQRGRAMLRQALFDCCHFEFDRRGSLVDFQPRPDCCENCR